MPRPAKGKWVGEKVQVVPGRDDCYIYKRPGSNTWQYYLSIPGEGEERKTTKVKGSSTDHSVGLEAAKDFALDRKLEVMSRQKQGLKARRVKKLFDFIDEFLDEEKKRIRPYNIRGYITQGTYRGKRTHLNTLKKFYKNKDIKVEDLDYPKLYEYPTWRQKVDSVGTLRFPRTIIPSVLNSLLSRRSLLIWSGRVTSEDCPPLSL